MRTSNWIWMTAAWLLGLALLSPPPVHAQDAQPAQQAQAAAAPEATEAVPEQIAPALTAPDEVLRAELARARYFASLGQPEQAEPAFRKALVLAQREADDAAIAAAAEGAGAMGIALHREKEAQVGDALLLALARYRRLSNEPGEARVSKQLTAIGRTVPPREAAKVSPPKAPAPVAVQAAPAAKPVPKPKPAVVEEEPRSTPFDWSWLGFGPGSRGATRFSIELARIVPDAAGSNNNWGFDMNVGVPFWRYFSLDLDGGIDGDLRFLYGAGVNLGGALRLGFFSLGLHGGVRYDGVTSGSEGVYEVPAGLTFPAFATLRISPSDDLRIYAVARVAWALDDVRKFKTGYPFIDNYKYSPNEASLEAGIELEDVDLGYRFARLNYAIWHSLVMRWSFH
jgi:hypothetical protein